LLPLPAILLVVPTVIKISPGLGVGAGGFGVVEPLKVFLHAAEQVLGLMQESSVEELRSSQSELARQAIAQGWFLQ
jgi:hypothetical protein